MVRLYIPVTSTLIEQLVTDGELTVDLGFAVTPALRAWYDNDDEELEYVASMTAAAASLELLAHDSQAKRRRAVLALEVPEVKPAEGDRAAVEVGSVIRYDGVESALIDEIDAQADIQAALQVWDRQDADAQFLRDQANSHELLWFARQELPFIF